VYYVLNRASERSALFYMEEDYAACVEDEFGGEEWERGKGGLRMTVVVRNDLTLFLSRRLTPSGISLRDYQ
jgi:hypothetical protein